MAMELSRISAVLDFYEAELRNYSFVSADVHLAHIVDDMIPAMRQMIARGAACNREKLMRWYGFIQGQLVAFGIFTLDAVKQHSNPAVPPPK